LLKLVMLQEAIAPRLEQRLAHLRDGPGQIQSVSILRAVSSEATPQSHDENQGLEISVTG
jgi:hypothetical protein